MGPTNITTKRKVCLQIQEKWEKFTVMYAPSSSSSPSLFSPSLSPLSPLSQNLDSTPSPGISYNAPYYSVFPPSIPSLNLNIYRETNIKILIKNHNLELYRVLKNVHFDGKYYQVKCIHLGNWEYCWELAVRIQFFGKMQGLAAKPEMLVSKKSRKIIYRSFILINPYELWSEELAKKLWNLQERIEFLIAKILFHECIHVLIFLGKSLPSEIRKPETFYEFQKLLELTNSEKLYSEKLKVCTCLLNLAELSNGFPINLEEPQAELKIQKAGSKYKSEQSEPELETESKLLSEVYEFLIHEKYSIQKTDIAFGFSWDNRKIARDYAKVAALKIGPCPASLTLRWNIEIGRLRRALEKLYEKLDEQ